jgi:REP element-mobilizing transposase RayT
MSQSLSKLYVHLVFSTKGREPWLRREWRDECHAWIAGALNGLDCPSVRTGGVEDHVHCLFVLFKNIALKDLVGRLKSSSSRWIKDRFRIGGFAWQGGYGAFSVSASQVDRVAQYVDSQEAHHRKTTFQDELRGFFRKYRIPYDEKHVWD